jgi:actin-related protein 3
MGYAGNLDPDFIIPTAIAELDKKSTLLTSNKNDEFNYAIGYDALNLARDSKEHALVYPMANGLISSWDLMEKYWNHSLYHYMKCDPESHYIVLTEPPMNPPENRENIAEIFFETFNVAGLYIGVQATFALLGCNSTIATESLDKQKEGKSEEEINCLMDQAKAINSLTGMVVDSGDGVTHVVPICDGYVLGSNIKHIPIAGRKITRFMMDMIKDRGENIRNEDLLYATMDIKEKYGYLCKDVVEEFSKYDKKDYDEINQKYSLNSKFNKYTGEGKISRKPFSIDIGHEVFLGPESFFSPEIIDKNYTQSIDEICDLTVQSCPVDYRRRLYSNIVMSGGSTMFKNFDKRMERALQKRVDDRLAKSSTGTIKVKL